MTGILTDKLELAKTIIDKHKCNTVDYQLEGGQHPEHFLIGQLSAVIEGLVVSASSDTLNSLYKIYVIEGEGR